MLTKSKTFPGPIVVTCTYRMLERLERERTAVEGRPLPGCGGFSFPVYVEDALEARVFASLRLWLR